MTCFICKIATATKNFGIVVKDCETGKQTDIPFYHIPLCDNCTTITVGEFVDELKKMGVPT